MNDTGIVGEAALRGRSPEELELDDLIFKRDLNEVYLLADFISGRPDRSLESLTMADPEGPDKKLLSGQIIQRIALIRYPPGGDLASNAKDAAFLLEAKDALNELVYPARGLTIAYTTMFVGADGEHGRGQRLIPGRRYRLAEDNRQKAGGKASRDSRLQLATAAFPGLRPHAAWFRRFRVYLMLFCVIWLSATVLTYWDVASGRSVLQRLDQFWKDRTAAIQANPDLLDSTVCKAYGPDQKGPPNAPPGDVAKKAAVACRSLWYLDQAREQAHAELTRVFRCSELTYTLPFHVWCWRWMLAGAVDADSNQVSWQSAASVLSVFTLYVLPMMFGLLGTVIGALRSLHDKVRDSRLAPRDLALTVLGLPLGVVAGVAVGLFFSPSSAPSLGSAATGLSLTASGIGFLGGYGSQTFFRLMDDLLRKVFPNDSEAPATRPGGG